MPLAAIVIVLIGICIIFTLIKWFMRTVITLLGVAICLWFVWQFVPASHALLYGAAQWAKTAWTHGRQFDSEVNQANKTVNQVQNALNQLKPLVDAAKQGVNGLTKTVSQ